MVVGVGAGIGGAVYVSGKLTEVYDENYHKTIDASKDVLDELKIPINEEITDELETILKAKRPNGTPVTIEVGRVDENLTEVSIRTGTVGVWDKEVSRQIQQYIEKKIGRPSSKKTKPVENAISDDPQLASRKPSVQNRTFKSAEDKIPQKQTTVVDISNESAQDILEDRLKEIEDNLNSNFQIYFQKDSNEISEQTKETLDQIYEIVSRKPDSELTINGYLNLETSDSYRKTLCDVRISSIEMYLIGKGVKPSKITSMLNNQISDSQIQNFDIKIKFQTR